MKRFEQAVSNPRYSIMRFHRPVKLKLRRRYSGLMAPVYPAGIYGSFYFDRERTALALDHSRCLAVKTMITEWFGGKGRPPAV